MPPVKPRTVIVGKKTTKKVISKAGASGIGGAPRTRKTAVVKRSSASSYVSMGFGIFFIVAIAMLAPMIIDKIQSKVDERKKNIKKKPIVYTIKKEVYNPKTGETRIVSEKKVVKSSSPVKKTTAVKKTSPNFSKNEKYYIKYDKAESAMKAGEFSEANKYFNSALRLDPPENDREKIEGLRQAAKLFSNVSKENIPSPKGKRDETILEDINELGSDAVATDYYFMAIAAYKGNLIKEGHKLLNKAYVKDKTIVESMYEFNARKIFAHIGLLESQGDASGAQKEYRHLISRYGRSKAAKIARLHFKDIIKTNTSSVSFARPAVRIAAEAKEDTDLVEGDRLVDEALALSKKARDSTSITISNGSYKKALKKLSDALEAYKKYQSKHPGDKALMGRFTILNRQKYWCQKMLSL